jgi:hypothetical protein
MNRGNFVVNYRITELRVIFCRYCVEGISTIRIRFMAIVIYSLVFI